MGASVNRYPSISSRRDRATTRLSGRQPSEALSKLTLHFLPSPAGDVGLGREHDVDAVGAPVSPEALPQETLRPVPLNRSPDASTHGEAKAIMALIVLGGNHEEERTVEANPSSEYSPELRRGNEPVVSWEPGLATPGRQDGSGPQPLPALLATPLQNEASPFAPHSDQEPVGPLAFPVVRLERPFHRWISLYRIKKLV